MNKEIIKDTARNVFFTLLVLFLLDWFSLINIGIRVNIWMFYGVFGVALTVYLAMSRYKRISKYSFLVCLIALTLTQFGVFGTDTTFLTVASIGLGIATFWLNRDVIEKEIEKENEDEEKAEQKRAKEFDKKFPQLAWFNFDYGITKNWKNKKYFISILRALMSPFIWIARLPYSFVKWMYKEGWAFSVPFFVIALVFIGIKIGMPLIYNGSYIDEYNHILSGVEFFKTGHFAEIYHGDYYTRGSYVSFSVGLFMYLFGQTIFVAKLIPTLMGLVNFFLLYKIANKLLDRKRYILLLMIIYSFSPWIILNHFYIRMYVFYEFFILLITYLIIKLTEFARNKKQKKCLTYFFITLIINYFLYFFSQDAEANLILLYSIISIGYFYLFETNSLNFKTNPWKVFFKSKLFKVSLTILLIFVLILWINSQGLIESFFYGKVKYTTPSNLKFDNFFFNINLPFSILFLFTFVFSLNRKNKQRLIILIPFFSLFILHLFSSKDLQEVRVILYILPLFYLFSLLIVNKLKSWYIFLIISLLLLLTLGGNYPKNFFKTPYIPEEVNYISNEAYESVKVLCEDSLLIISSRPAVAYSWKIHPDYYINTKYNDASWKLDEEYNLSFYDSEKDTYYDSATGVPLITNLKDLQEIVNKNSKICYLEGGLPPSWVDSETRKFMYSNFKMQGLYPSNGYSFEMRLYVKNI